ncbi:MAG: hypothetical protein LBV30_05355 [Propionibacteriaceae bacterium]|jgi:hypothetical protein|nr:hypothetical protein [Propionibacteriaceae bacterium]
MDRGGAVAIASVLAFLGAPSVFADEADYVAEQMASVIAELAPDAGAVVDPVDAGDAVPQVQADGSVLLAQTLEQGPLVVETIVGQVEPAWAFDADGRPVDTWYEVTGAGELVQVINPDATAEYPIVADPTWGFTWQGINIYFNKKETSDLANWKVGIAALVVGIIPGGQIPGLIAGGVNVAASWALSANMCLKYTWPLTISAFGRYSGGNCK